MVWGQAITWYFSKQDISGANPFQHRAKFQTVHPKAVKTVTFWGWDIGWDSPTLPETNMTPENRQRAPNGISSNPIIDFQVLLLMEEIRLTT